jgi:predicted dinucleotide-binding enzyme
MLVLAVHYEVVKDVLKAAGNLEGKILIDITNPLSPDFSGLSIGHTSSAAEKIAELVPKTRVIKSFNHAFANTFIAGPLFGSEKATLFYCGDDSNAKAKVAKLIADIGFDAVDAGPLKSARYLEPLAMLIIHLGLGQKMGANIAYKLLRR